MTRTTITLLHLSDTQFGRNHRFGRLALPPDDSFDTLLTRLGDDLRLLEKDHGLKPDLAVLSGDLAEWGRKSEFDDMLQFVEGLVNLLKLSRDRVVLIPGNHDINRKACEAYFNSCEGDETEPKSPFWPKWRHYVDFFQRFYRDCLTIEFTESEYWTFFEMPNLKLVVAGLNSTVHESHREVDHYGWVGEAQLRWFVKKLEDYKQRDWLRIAAVHHNVQRKAVVDDENLRDAEDLERILGSSINIILHGHTHDGKLGWLNQKVPILCTGSAALIKETRPEEIPNQYQIIQIWRDRFKRWTRAYLPDRKGWTGDTRASAKGNDWRDEQKVNFEAVDATFPPDSARNTELDLSGMPDPLKGRKHFGDERRDDFLNRVERVCRLRETEVVEVEPQRVGSPSLDYLRVSVKQGNIAQVYPVGISEHGVDERLLVRICVARIFPIGI